MGEWESGSSWEFLHCGDSFHQLDVRGREPPGLAGPKNIALSMRNAGKLGKYILLLKVILPQIARKRGQQSSVLRVLGRRGRRGRYVPATHAQPTGFRFYARDMRGPLSRMERYERRSITIHYLLWTRLQIAEHYVYFLSTFYSKDTIELIYDGDVSRQHRHECQRGGMMKQSKAQKPPIRW